MNRTTEVKIVPTTRGSITMRPIEQEYANIIPIYVINIKYIEIGKERCTMVKIMLITDISHNSFLKHKKRLNPSSISTAPNNVTISEIRKYVSEGGGEVG